ncbi:NAD(P)/FAD-dependent oxidoreductase [Nocardioides sp. CBS4Y-1]|uniref:NAD(P)/FAD-dependent oxidoreductase n=2 Tax=Nocardioides acrostichi TaxID=2784339 RepID=A0A930Y860_9ACTN|nr:NAD(P)/FAD-dependent oxidoreductase [Nocardioides acrostichi]
MRTAQALRAAGSAESITILGAETHHPYDKPPLSKEMLLPGGSDEPVPLLSAEELEALAVDLHLGTRATGLDLDRRVVTTQDGAEYAFEQLVIATGVNPRTLPGADELEGVHTLRNAEDSVALRASLAGAEHVVVVGAGFIGAEFAAAARAHGKAVTMIETQPVPLTHVLGEAVGSELARLHALNGVRVHAGVGFSHFVGDGASGRERVAGVALDDGRVLPADLVVVGIGATPATEWLASSGLPIGDGIECDAELRVLGVDGVFAAGDIARWPHPLYGTDLRIEHWTNANEHAGVIAATLTGTPPPRPQVPYVWSDQYGHRIQIVGRPADGTVALLHGDVESGLVAVYADAVGRVTGALVVDDPRTLMKCRRAATQRLAIADLDLGLAGSTPA